MSKKMIIGSYDHDKLLHPYSKKQYQKARNKKARKRFYKATWKKYWTSIDWNVFWDFIEPGC